MGPKWRSRKTPLKRPKLESNQGSFGFRVYIYIIYIPGSSSRDPFGCFIRDLFKGEKRDLHLGYQKVTWKKLEDDFSFPKGGGMIQFDEYF